ncbi:uncharacterized protein N7529_010954 [Penicillium soppii]|uniref:uncharacterized protein n=1 Tax=Penicillium soppii TaxID=69789 RepID=UPI0025479E5B|nr:uncharacterized protein N7529_010954 [Penicillium soppii]KAJ5851569.1 hypothetical protein N7529_010954 [Penicillium soppii]
MKVVYLATFALDKGQSLMGLLRGNYLPWRKVEVGTFDIIKSTILTERKGDYVHANDADDTVSQDLNPEQQENWGGLPQHIFRGTISPAPNQLRAGPSLAAFFFKSKLGGAGTAHRLSSSHSLFLCMSDRLVGVLKETVKM